MTGTGHELLERIIRAGTATDEEIDALIGDAGLDAVMDVLVDEVLFRCASPVNDIAVDIALDLTHGTGHRRVVFRIVQDGPVTVVDGGVGVVRRELRMTVAALLRRLFGRTELPRAGDFHDTFLPTRPDDLRELSGILAATSTASGTLLGGCTVPIIDLGARAVEHGSDKWASFHWYAAHYQKHLATYRDRPVRVLEIGIGGFTADLGGGSLRAWKEYFHRGMVYGIDLFDKSELDQQRLTTLVCDQGDARALEALAEQYGPFDIIIDDGSHENEHIRVSFDALFPHLRADGVYVIEDLQTAYFPRFGGSEGVSAGPNTSVGLLKRLVDDIHRGEQEPVPDGPRAMTTTDVIGVAVYRNIAFIEKGVNGENGLPGWMDDEAWIALGAIPPATDPHEEHVP